MRFCSYCGFKLGVVKAALADDDEIAAMDHSTMHLIPKAPGQRDINIGVILMSAGALLATLLAGSTGDGLGRYGGGLILTISFFSILLLSRPLMKLIYKLLSWEEPPAELFSVNQRGMAFGSMLMFASTIVLAISSLLIFGRMRTPQLFAGLVIAFLLLLIISKHLMQALRYLVAADANVTGVSQTNAAHEPVAMGGAVPAPALTPGQQDIPVSLFTSQRVTTAEIMAPASVTEQTTNLLENK